MEPIEELQRIMPRSCDAALIVSKHNRRYFTGFSSDDGLLFITRHSATLLEDFRYIEAARAQAKGCRVVMLESGGGQLGRLVAGSGARSVSVEAKELTLAEYAAFHAELQGVELDGSSALGRAIEGLRMIKQPPEIEHIRRAQAITDAAFTHILEYIKPGVSERELALEIEFFMRKNGASGPSFDLIVVSGENTSRPHGVPGGRRVRAGDFVTMDTGAVVEGYCSDMTRTVAVGGVSPAMRHVYDTVLRAQLEAEQAVRAGAVCSEVDGIARRLIDNAGYRGCFGHGLGHSVGLQIHEEPRLSPGCGERLREGMLMTVEPGVYLEGGFGVRIEDLVIITSDGCEILTKSPKELMVL